jgi:hypothetical protein
MHRKKALKLTGFAAALCASGALVGISVSGTGAYFTDSHDGSINATSGHLKVAVSPQSGALNFSQLLPGEYQKQTITYTANVTGHEDVWLVFPDHGSDAFSMTPQDGPVPLGRYGHLNISSTNGASFVSNNLASPGTGSHAGPSCTVDPNGEGGSSQEAANQADHSVPFCPAPGAILLASNLANGQGGTATVEFGYTKLLKSLDGNGNSTEDVTAPAVPFQIVATQHGISPTDENNG